MFLVLTFLVLGFQAALPAAEEVASVEVGADASIAPSPPQFREVPGPPPQTYWVTFENQSPEKVELYYDDGREGTLQGEMQPGKKLQIGTYVGHQFYYRRPGQHRKLFLTTMQTGNTHVPFQDEATRDAEEVSRREEAQAFKQKYRDETGRDWRAFYPRPKPILHMFPVESEGQTFEVHSNHTHYHCYPQTESEEDIAKCRNDNSTPLIYEWTVVSVSPKVMELKGAQPFLSEFERNHIIDLATPRASRSVVGAGGYENLSRTSTNAWVKRSYSDVMDWIFRRIADVTKIPESHLWDTIGAESLQVVHYGVGQQYKAHHDWRTNRAQTRFMTFLMYLNDQASPEAGGETAFPQVGIKVHPGGGNVAAFYDLLEDGNVDPLTLHAALPVKEGEKWLANVWIWDPNFS